MAALTQELMGSGDALLDRWFSSEHLKAGLASQQTLLLGVMQSLTALSGNVATLEVRVGRIERRLELGS